MRSIMRSATGAAANSTGRARAAAEAASSCLIEVRGEQLMLLPEHALYWPARQLLMVADIHFGKAAAFRAHGIPVPRGTTTENLQALDRLLAAHAVRELVFLGDFLHARTARASATLAALQHWRERHPDLQLTLVRGNHDQHAGDPPAALGIRMVEEPHAVGPFALSHHPDTASGLFVIAGHVHPVFRLAVGGDRLRLPCFVLTDQACTLPAFGSFTGGHAVEQQPGRTIYLVAGDEIVALPQREALARNRR